MNRSAAAWPRSSHVRHTASYVRHTASRSSVGRRAAATQLQPVVHLAHGPYSTHQIQQSITFNLIVDLAAQGHHAIGHADEQPRRAWCGLSDQTPLDIIADLAVARRVSVAALNFDRS